MKNLLILTFLLISFFAVAQATTTITHKEVSGLNQRPSVKIEGYVASNGDTFNIGDTLNIGNPSGINGNFTHIVIYLKGFMQKIIPVKASANNTKTIIKKIKVVGSKAMGFKLSFQCKWLMARTVYLIDIEAAIKSGEIVTDGLTSEQALKELSKAKKKLDLELITKEQYDKIKAELSPFIE